MQKDFAPITLISATPLILVVHPAVPAKTVQELADHAKANQGKLNYGSPGDGSVGHLALKQFRAYFGLKMTHTNFG